MLSRKKSSQDINQQKPKAMAQSSAPWARRQESCRVVWKRLPALAQLLTGYSGPWYYRLGVVGDGCWAWDAKPVGIHHPFALQYVRVKGLHPADPWHADCMQTCKIVGIKVGLQCLVHAWICPLQDLYVMRRQMPMGASKSLRRHS